MIKTTIPTDKSDKVYFDDADKELVSTKPLLVFYKMTGDVTSFKRAQYVHSRKIWIDWEGFRIYDDEFIGWYDADLLLKENSMC